LHLGLDFLKLPNQTDRIDGMGQIESLREVADRLGKLALRSNSVSALQMMETDRGLNESLIEPAERWSSFPPEVLPGFMGFEVVAVIKKI